MKLLLVLFLSIACVGNDSFTVMAKKMTESFDAPIVRGSEVISDEYIFLDARELNEYEVSHLREAIHIGYEEFDLEKVEAKISKDKKYIVYCSVGYRSGDIAERLNKSGYSAFNLYGGIFQWKNKGKPIYSLGSETNLIHGYNEEWAKYIEKGNVVLDD